MNEKYRVKTYSKRPDHETTLYPDCPVCNIKEHTYAFTSEQVHFHTCNKCGLLIQVPQPVHEDLVNRYDNDYFIYEKANEVIFFELILKSLDDISFFTATAPKLLPGAQLLDVGCATGKFLEFLSAKGWRTQGVEVCAASAEYGREVRKVPIITGTFEEAEFPDKIFDVVHSSHLIEHLVDPAGFIKEAYRVLKPGGYLVTTTPNSTGFQAFLFKAGWRSVIPDHLHLFSRHNLQLLVQNHGFKTEIIKTWGGLAAGTAPLIIKKIADHVVKYIGVGDVMILQAQK